MSLLLLPFEVIIKNVVRCLPIPSVAAVAAVAPFANFGAPEFAAAVHEAVEHARRQFAPLVQHGLNVPVFEHRVADTFVYTSLEQFLSTCTVQLQNSLASL